jgi:hypothetical protein
VVTINFSTVSVTLHCSVTTTPVYNDTKHPVPLNDVITELDCNRDRKEKIRERRKQKRCIIMESRKQRKNDNFKKRKIK